jgi:hypothetical protein
VPSGAPVAVTVNDSRGAKLFDKKLPVTRFGGFSFDLALGEERRPATTRWSPA